MTVSSPLPRLLSRTALAAMSLAFAAASLPAQAQFATGGTGLYRNSIYWVNWGQPGANVFGGATITRQVPIGSGGATLDITCRVSNASAVAGQSTLQVYTPGGWQGDGLDDLYNIGGAQPGQGANPNQLRVGLATAQSSEVAFDFDCTGAISGTPVDIDGLVFADAEASDGSEFVAAELPQGSTIRIIDQISQCGSSTNVQVVGSTVQFRGPAGGGSCENDATPSRRAGPALVGFIDGASSARVSAKGGGVSAIALGAVVQIDYSESLPASYGEAVHLLDVVWEGGVAMSGVNYNALPGGTLAALAVPTYTHRFGALVFPDQDSSSPVGAGDVDGLPTRTGPNGAGYADVTPPSAVAEAGSIYSIAGIQCVGGVAAGYAAGWIDFNGNGAFDAAERSATAVCPAGAVGSITLEWAVPADIVAQATGHLRLRTSASESSIALPVGVAQSGEVEDYYLDILGPSVTVSKVANGPWQVGQTDASYTLTVGNEGGDSTTGAAISVLDQLPEGILPGWDDVLTSGDWTCEAAAQVVTCQSDVELAVDATSLIELPVRVTSAALDSTVTNFASAGGGGDPFNAGEPLPPGTCMDPDNAAPNHCGTVDTNVEAGETDLAITKAVTPLTAAVGDDVTYTLVALNKGPTSADGASIRDPVVAGLDCSAAVPVCDASGGAVCPASPTMAALQSASGLIIATFPVDGAMTLEYTCTVTASGAPITP